MDIPQVDTGPHEGYHVSIASPTEQHTSTAMPGTKYNYVKRRTSATGRAVVVQPLALNVQTGL